MKEKYIRAFMECARTFAQCSTATRLKVGCIVVKDDKIISVGVNGTPSRWHSNVCEDEKGLTLPEVLHSESNALMKICASHESSEGAIMFCTHSPCLSCAKLILQAKIKSVYFAEEYRSREGIEFLEEAGVEVCWLE